MEKRDTTTTTTMSDTMDGEEGTAQRQESPTPIDLLGLDEIRRDSAANQHQKQDNEEAMIEVKVVELGSALYGGELKSYRGPRKHSPMSRLLAGTASVNPSGYVRARGRVRSGEKMYKGRMNQVSQQQPQQEQQQQLEQQQQRRQPDNIDKAKQQQVGNDHSKFGAAPWANIRRRSRDSADKIRRRLTSSGPTTERVRQAQNDSEEHQAEMAQLRLIRRHVKQKEELERLEQRSQRKELPRQSSSRRNCTTSAMIVPFQKQLLEENEDDSTIISGKRNEHQTENPETNDKNMDGLEGNGNGHDDDTNVKELGNNEKNSMREELAKSLNISEGFANNIAPSAVRRPMHKRRSLDSSLSLRLTASLITGEGTYRVEDPAEKLPDRQRGRQRRSLDSSLKLAEATEALLLAHDIRPQRRSSSCDTHEPSTLFKPAEGDIMQRATGEISKRSEDDMMLDWKKKVYSRENLKEFGGGVDYGLMKRKDSTTGMDMLDMLDKMDIKKNNESNAVKTIPGRFNRHSSDVKTIDSTREKGQSRTGDVPEVREKTRRQSSIDFRPEHGAQSQREKSERRISEPPTRLIKQVPSSVAAREKQKKLSTKLNFPEHRARSQGGDEESSKKSSQKSSQKKDLSQQRGSQASSEKRNSRSDKRRMSTKLNTSEHYAQSQSEDEKSSKKSSQKKDLSQQRGAQAASEKRNSRSDKRRGQILNGGILGAEMKDQSDKSGREKTGFLSRRFNVSPLAICTMCLCYSLSIVLCAWLGFFLHMTFFSDMIPSSVNQSYDDPELIGTSPSLRPSYGPGQNATNYDATTKVSNSSMAPSLQLFTRPSLMPTTSSPSINPSTHPTSTPTLSYQPTLNPSDSPSSSPTGIPGCPDTLLNWVPLGEDDLLTLKYEVVVYQGAMSSALGGGLLCVSLEYAGSAGWIGLAFSEASRDPHFGLKEAIIGIPGLPNSVAVAEGGSASLGQQSNVALEDGPAFINPAKYLIPAGGTGKDGYSGPSLNLLVDVDKQTLVNGSVSVVVDQQSGGIISGQNEQKTRLSFVKYLREVNEIMIDPYGSTLLLYVVASLDSEGEYDGNPEWQSTTLTLLANSSTVKGYVRKRTRQHHEIPNH